MYVQQAGTGMTDKDMESVRPDPVEGNGSAPGKLSLHGFRVLVVDDEPDIVDLICATLESEGLEVLRATTADEALQLMHHRPDLALLDVNLGSSSGFDLLEELRRHSSMPVIMLTARTAEEDAVRGLTLGADDYIRKPFDLEELVARIEARLRRR
jgi:DNA-binding response OmpR family regulator